MPTNHPQPVVIVRRDDNGSLDEVSGPAHLECMGRNEWALIFGRGKNAFIVYIKGKVTER